MRGSRGSRGDLGMGASSPKMRIRNGSQRLPLLLFATSDRISAKSLAHSEIKLYGYINGKAVELTGNPAFNVEYEKDQVKVYWLRKDLSPLPAALPVTCPTATTASKISC